MKRFLILIVSVFFVLGFAGTSPAAYYADIAYVIDQSGSMGDEFNWLGTSINTMNATLTSGGITANYGLAGFELYAGTEPTGYSGVNNAWADIGSSIADIQSQVTYADNNLYGGRERSYHAAGWAADNFSWTGGDYVKVIILITDEFPYDTYSSTYYYSYAGLSNEAAVGQKMADEHILLNVITSTGLYSYWDGAVYSSGSYQGLFDLNYLRTDPTGFTNAFVNAKMTEIIHATPEPATLLLLGLGFLGIGVLRRR